VLKPGGKLLVIDGDFVNPTLVAKIAGKLSALLARFGGRNTQPQNGPGAELAETHRSILSRVYFSEGARAEAVADLLKAAGFSSVVIDTDMSAIHRTQRKNFNFLKGLERAAQHRYAVCASK
jgi:hypothetical protein